MLEMEMPFSQLPFTAVTRCHFMDGCVELNTDFGSGVLADESESLSLATTPD